MKNFFLKIKTLLKLHKIVSLVVLAGVGYGGYWGYQNLKPAAAIEYLTEPAQTTTITVTVAGSGQVSEVERIDLKPLLSGALTAIKVKNGDLVTADQTIATIDQRGARTAVDQARASLASAQANLDKLLAGATADDIKLSQNSLSQAEASYRNALTALDNTKKSTANSVAQAEQELGDLLSTTAEISSTNKRGAVITTIADKLSSTRAALDAENKILTDENAKPTLGAQNPSALAGARGAYDQAVILLEAANSALAAAKTDKTDGNLDLAVSQAIAAINKTIDSLNSCFDALQGSVVSTKFTQSQLDSYKSSVSAQLTNMSAAVTAIQTSSQALKDAIVQARNSLDDARLTAESQLTSAQSQITSTYNSWQSAKVQLDKLKAPATASDIAVARAQVRSAQAQLESASSDLDNTVITTPLGGEVAELNVKKGDQVGPSTVVATIISKRKMAVIPLNEVEVAKIKIGQAATLTFDALEGLSIAGRVVEIAALGTATQGVVTYDVNIVFDTQDDRVKPGMSTSANVITGVKTDVLAVPNSALKTADGNYVEMLGPDGTTPRRQAVETGITSDSLVEITDGLKEGDQVVTQTIDPNATTVSQTAGPGGGQRSGFGGSVFFGR